MLLLQPDLQERDIPHRTTISNRILELQAEHFKHLTVHMQVCSQYSEGN
jgi:hypothetical protein